MTYDEIEKEIRGKFSSNYTRTNFDNFLLNNNLKFNFKGIHVTGTNGKGSTCKYFYEVLKDANYNVGIFTSPYFYNLRETIIYNGKEISEEEFTNLYLKYRDSILQFKLTEFEIQTLIAFLFFQSKNVDVAIIECGMGGALDATNIFTPILSVVTSISIEHTSYLGTSVSDIAVHKAGIFKKGVDALVGDLDEQGMGTVKRIAAEVKAPLTLTKKNIEFAKRDNCILFNYDKVRNIVLNTNASYQVKNASIVVEGCFILQKYFKISEQNIKNGLNTKPFDFRFEFLKSNVILDGAHNVEAIKALVKDVVDLERPIHVIFASFRDKNIETILPLITAPSEDLALTYFPHPRCRGKDDYFLYLDDYEFFDDYQECYDQIKSKHPNDVILFTGSLAFCGFIKKNLKL